MEAGGQPCEVKPASTPCDSSDHTEEAIGGMCDQRHLPGVYQERGMQPWVCELSEASFQRRDDSMKGSTSCFWREEKQLMD